MKLASFAWWKFVGNLFDWRQTKNIRSITDCHEIVTVLIYNMYKIKILTFLQVFHCGRKYNRLPMWISCQGKKKQKKCEREKEKDIIICIIIPLHKKFTPAWALLFYAFPVLEYLHTQECTQYIKCLSFLSFFILISFLPFTFTFTSLLFLPSPSSYLARFKLQAKLLAHLLPLFSNFQLSCSAQLMSTYFPLFLSLYWFLDLPLQPLYVWMHYLVGEFILLLLLESKRKRRETQAFTYKTI